jgi:hypothetical protein
MKSSRAATSLLSLPRKLQIHILEYTDLVNPWKEVTESREVRGYQLQYPNCSDSMGGMPTSHTPWLLAEPMQLGDPATLYDFT